MNAITGAVQSAAVSQLFLNVPVQSVRRIPAGDERMPPSQADRYVPSAALASPPQITYGRNGQGGGGQQFPAQPQPVQLASLGDADHDGDST